MTIPPVSLSQKKPLPSPPPPKKNSLPAVSSSSVTKSEGIQQVANQAITSQISSQGQQQAKADVQRILVEAKAFQEKKKKDKALTSCQQALGLAQQKLETNDPLIVECLLELGNCLNTGKQKERAVPHYEEARVLCTLHRHSPLLLSRAYVGLADCALSKKDLDEAKRCLDEALKCSEEENATTAKAYLLMGLYYSSSKDPEIIKKCIYWMNKANELSLKLEKK